MLEKIYSLKKAEALLRRYILANSDINQEVASMLRQLARNQTHTWKATAYSRAADSISKWETPLSEMESFKEIPGVGEDIDQEIREYLETGKIQKLEILKKEEVSRRPFTAMEVIDKTKALFDMADKVGLIYEITGSIRRKEERVRDLDIIILIKQMKQWNTIVDAIAEDIHRKGEQEIDFEINGVEINLRAVNEDELSAGVLYFTGPSSYSIWMRQIAKEKVYKLNRRGLFDAQENQIAKTEEDIFKKLDIPWTPPEKR